MTPEQENQIMQQLSQLSESDRRRHTSNQQAFLNWTGNVLGGGFAAHLLSKHAWPELERKIEEWLKRIR